MIMALLLALAVHAAEYHPPSSDDPEASGIIYAHVDLAGVAKRALPADAPVYLRMGEHPADVSARFCREWQVEHIRGCAENLIEDFLWERMRTRPDAALWEQAVPVPERHNSMHDRWMRNSLERLRRLGFVPSSILDVGAHHGSWTLSAKSVFLDAQFVMVEPVEYPEIVEYAKRTDGVELKHALVDSEERDVEWCEMGKTGDSIYRENSALYDACVPTMRRTTTLDALFSAAGDARGGFDLIKLDVQGAELPVLRGGGTVVAGAAVVVMEMPFVGQYNRDVASFAEHITYMDSLGFVPLDVSDVHYLSPSFETSGGGVANGAALVQIDIMFIRRGHPILDRIQSFIENI